MSLTKSPVLRLSGVSKSFGNEIVVDALSFEVAPAEIVALIGPSGCGKTTTLRLVAGLEMADAGRIEIDGIDAEHVQVHKRNVGLVFQDHALFPHLSVVDNVSFGLGGSRVEKRVEKAERAKQVLDMVGMANLAERFPSELSGGQQQRVALARAIAPQPSILCLDEPFSDLDPQLRRQVRHEVLSMIRSAGIAALWVTHDHDEGLLVGDRVVVMDKGRARQVGSPGEVWHHPIDAWVAGFIGNGDLVGGVVKDGRAITPLGAIRVDDMADGLQVQVLVRPHDLAFDPGGYAGKVVRRHFSGSDNVYCVQLQAGGLLHVKQPQGVEIERNTEVGVRLSTDDLKVFVS